MRVIDPGHHYELTNLDVGLEVYNFSDIVFVKREGVGYPGNVGHHSGTNCQEVLRVLIDRVKYLDNQIPDDNNETILGFLRLAVFNFEERAARRHGRKIS